MGALDVGVVLPRDDIVERTYRSWLSRLSRPPERMSFLRRSWIIRHPIVTFLVLVYATTRALVFVPKDLTEPGLLPGGATPHGILENILGSAVPAFIVTAL